MVFIDWISTPAHRTFNRALFAALNNKEMLVYVYSKKLEIPGHVNICQEVSSNRLLRAASVIRTCYRNRGNRIFFLTFDPLLLPLAVLFCRSVFVFEHNTTPEGGTFSKHAIWQKLLFHRVTRFAQFPGQLSTLTRLGQNAVFLGSPLLEDGVPLTQADGPPLLVAPSERLDLAELARHRAIFDGYPIIVRNVALSRSEQGVEKTTLELRGVDWISDAHLRNAKAIIIGTTSPVRGSGWFNEAIRYGIPLVITSVSAQQLFEGTYPGYPYIRAQELGTSEDLDLCSSEIRSVMATITKAYVSQYNDALKRRFFEALEQHAVHSHAS